MNQDLFEPINNSINDFYPLSLWDCYSFLDSMNPDELSTFTGSRLPDTAYRVVNREYTLNEM